MAPRIYEAAIDNTGQITILETVVCSGTARALVVILEGEGPSSNLTITSAEDREIVTTPAVYPCSGPKADAPSWIKRYRVVRPLGQGGMGQAVLAERISDNASVCLKFLLEGVDLRIFEQECRALLRLRHPLIVALVDFSAGDSPPWIATEYATGVTLRAHLNGQGPLSTQVAVEILTQILEALTYAHSQQVVHRDLKPSNVMVDPGQSGFGIRVLDFGLALVDSRDFGGHATAMGRPIGGTFLYMAPEQMEASLLSPACDIYPLGLIAWEMLVGRPAMPPEFPRLILEKFKPLSKSKLGELPVGVPSELRDFIECSTQLEPAKRPTAAEALANLGRIRI